MIVARLKAEDRNVLFTYLFKALFYISHRHYSFAISVKAMARGWKPEEVVDNG